MNEYRLELDCLMDQIELFSTKLVPTNRNFKRTEFDDFIKTKVKLDANNEFGKPKGTYITYDIKNEQDTKSLIVDFRKEIKKIIGRASRVLVVGIGNDVLLSDSLGPKVVNNLDINTDSNNKFYKFCPNVASNTGIDSFDIIKSVVNITKPEIIIAIDSLASRNFNRVGTSFQISDSGMVPGSGCGKKNQFMLNKETLGVPVIAIGVPMVVHIKSYLYEVLSSINMEQANLLNILSNENLNALNGVILAPKEIDIILDFCAKIILGVLNGLT